MKTWVGCRKIAVYFSLVKYLSEWRSVIAFTRSAPPLEPISTNDKGISEYSDCNQPLVKVKIRSGADE